MASVLNVAVGPTNPIIARLYRNRIDFLSNVASFCRVKRGGDNSFRSSRAQLQKSVAHEASHLRAKNEIVRSPKTILRPPRPVKAGSTGIVPQAWRLVPELMKLPKTVTTS